MVVGIKYFRHRFWLVDYEHCLDCINDSTHYILYMMIDSWLFYLLVLGFGLLAIYLMDIGIFK